MGENQAVDVRYSGEISKEPFAVKTIAAVAKLLLPTPFSGRMADVEPTNRSLMKAGSGLEVAGLGAAFFGGQPELGAVTYGLGRMLSLIAESTSLKRQKKQAQRTARS